jgi:alpha-N-arabinofuranosidase
MRKSLLDALRKIQPPVMRWPGGCFADSYNWRDGVGPRAARPRRSNFWINSRELWRVADTAAKYDPNSFGTPEFLRFCQLVGAKPYLAANVRSLPAKDFYEWVEYCNSPAGSTTLADLRAADGSKAPYGVQYWGIGNESWGCGGDFTPEEYSLEFRKFTSWVPRYGVDLRYIPAGPNGGDLNWSRGFLEGLVRKSRGLLGRVWGWALHYYCGTSGKGQALDYTLEDWYDLLSRADRMDSLISEHWAVMRSYDTERRIKLVVDEWGAWHRAGSEVAPDHLFGQQSTMRDALIAGLTLDTFHRHADKVAMANVAQMINCLHSLFLAAGGKFVETTNYHVFDMYQSHKGGQAVRSVFSAPPSSWKADSRERIVLGMAGSASLKGKTLTVTGINTHASESRQTEIALRGGSAKSAAGLALYADKLQAHNSFDQPQAVKPRPVAVTGSGAALSLTVPPASVVKVTIELV